MTLYESNFIKLDHLVGRAMQDDGYRVSTSESDCDLHLEFLQREPYTTTMKLTYWFDDARRQRVPDPDLTVRIYHDARLAEAVDARRAHRHHVLQELARSHSHVELDRRWRRNIMLNKWLDYLIDMGHAFG